MPRKRVQGRAPPPVVESVQSAAAEGTTLPPPGAVWTSHARKGSGGGARRPDCMFYVKGTCSKGDLCVFRHSNRARFGTHEVCPTWERTRDCDDPACPHLHPKMVAPAAGPAGTASVASPFPPIPWARRPDCLFFLRSACNKGARCPFRHNERTRTGPDKVCRAWINTGVCSDPECVMLHPKIKNPNFPGPPSGSGTNTATSTHEGSTSREPAQQERRRKYPGLSVSLSSPSSASPAASPSSLEPQPEQQEEQEQDRQEHTKEAETREHTVPRLPLERVAGGDRSSDALPHEADSGPATEPCRSRESSPGAGTVGLHRKARSLLPASARGTAATTAPYAPVMRHAPPQRRSASMNSAALIAALGQPVPPAQWYLPSPADTGSPLSPPSPSPTASPPGERRDTHSSSSSSTSSSSTLRLNLSLDSACRKPSPRGHVPEQCFVDLAPVRLTQASSGVAATEESGDQHCEVLRARVRSGVGACDLPREVLLWVARSTEAVQRVCTVVQAHPHPGLARCWGHTVLDGVGAAVVCEALDPAHTLEARLASGVPLARRERLSVALGIAQALLHLAEHGTAHGRLCPALVQLNGAGGFPVTLHGYGSTLLDPTAGLRRPPWFVAPQDLPGMRGDDGLEAVPVVQEQADVYSLGVVLLLMVTGHTTPPLPPDAASGESDEAAYCRLLRLCMVRGKSHCLHVPQGAICDYGLARVADKCCRVCPDRRPKLAQVVDTLSNLLRLVPNTPPSRT